MGVKNSTAALAAAFAMGISAAPAAAAPYLVEFSGTVVSADGNWAGSVGEAFTSQQTVDDGVGATGNTGNATLVEGSGVDTWWWFQGGSYGFNYLSAMLGGGSLFGSTVWLETLDDFSVNPTNNPFGLDYASPVDVVTISGGDIIATCAEEEKNPLGQCPENSANNDGVEFSISFIATSDWFSGQGVYPSVEPANLLAVWGTGIEYTGGQVSANAIIEFNTVPLPAALPMFVAGLGVLGFFGFRRNRAAAA